MNLHLIDGTYELFRHYFAVPSATLSDGTEVGATRGVLASLISLLRDPQTSHVACAFDTEIRSFRNDMFAGYKTGEGIEPELHAQFPLIERGTRALGLTTWSMVEFEADDALAAGAAQFGDDPRVDRVLICTPDKDLAQAVRGDHIVGFDRRKREMMNEAGVVAKFGVGPASIPDYLALVGDAQDGIPGLPKWGAKSTAAVLGHYEHLEAIPDDDEAWEVKVRGAKGLAATLASHREEATLYRKLATLRTDVPLNCTVDDLQWRGPTPEFATFCEEIGAERLLDRLPKS